MVIYLQTAEAVGRKGGRSPHNYIGHILPGIKDYIVYRKMGTLPLEAWSIQTNLKKI